MLKDCIRLIGLIVIFILCICGNGFAYTIQGGLTSSNYLWGFDGIYGPSFGWYLSPHGDAFEGVEFFRVISEYGNTGTILASFYLSGGGEHVYDITGINCTAEIGFSPHPSNFYIYRDDPPYGQVSEIEIGCLYHSRIWAYPTDPYILDLTVIDPTKDASFAAFGNVTVQFNLVLPEEKPAVPEPATMLLLGSGLILLAGYGRKKFFKK